MGETRWWHPDRFAARRPFLETRRALTDSVRDWFRAEGFWEVETPALQVSPGLEPHLSAFATEYADPTGPGTAARFYLHTSPEFAMKKLLAAGAGNIFQLARSYRNGERSPTHHPEFTMLEWYRTGATYRDLMADCEALLKACAAALPPGRFRHGGRESDASAPWDYVTVNEAFRRHADVDLLATATNPDAPAPELLAAEARRIGVRTAAADSWEDVFFRIFLDRVEPELGLGAPTVLYDYPVSMAALSRRKPDDACLAERFEIYVCGLELANGFSELTDVVEQRRRFETDIARKQSLYGYSYPIDEDFLSALELGLPQCAGIALGFDRLVMLAAGADDIEQVLWAPVSGAPPRSPR